MPVTKEQATELAELFVGQMTPMLEQRDAEIKKLGDALGETKAALTKIDAAMTEIETKGKRPANGGTIVAGADDETKQRQVAAFKDLMRHGFFRMDRANRELLLQAQPGDVQALQNKAAEIKAEFKAFSIADDTLGGYFVLPEIVQNEIIKQSILFSPVRQLAKVQQTSGNSIEIPVRRGVLSASWVAETNTRTETLGQNYGKAVIPTHEMYAFSLFSRQLLEDEYFDLQAEIQADMAEQFAVAEGAAFVNGTGVGKPRGFLANVTTNITTAASSSAIAYADVVKTFMALKPAYRNSPNCKWVMNQAVLSVIRQITDSNGRPIFQVYADSGLSLANPGTIMGVPYVEATDMPSAVSGTNRTLAVGDFTRAYRFVDRVQMSVQRLEELYAATGQVGLLVHKRVGGDLVLDEALSILKQS